MKKENIAIKFIIISSIILILTFPFSAYVHNAYAGSMGVNIRDVAFNKQVKTVKDIKFENVIKQTKDYSCGAAATATIFTYYFGIIISEEEVLAAMLRDVDSEKRDKVMKKGFSLFDLKHYGEQLGYKAGGYRVPLHLLHRLDRPAITLINNNGYSHFIVIKGVKDEKIYFADPAKGNLVWDIEKFSNMWNGILLLFENRDGKEIQTHALSVKTTINKNSLFSIARSDYMTFAINPSEF